MKLALPDLAPNFPGVIMAAILLLVTAFEQAQASRFTFDNNGNLTAQLSENNLPPQILGQPQDQVVATDEFARFSVVVANPRLMSYQWQFNGVNIPGRTNDVLLLANVGTSEEAEYRVVLTNPFGSVTSASAGLWIDDDGDNLGDAWELSHFGSLQRTATSDFDGDGLSNLREFRDRSDPTDAGSAFYRLLVIQDGGAVIKSPDRSSYHGETVTLTAVPPANGLFHAWLGDIVSRNNPVSLVMTNDKTVYARFTPVIYIWTNTVSGDWNVAANWKPPFVPGLNDSVIITNNVTVTLNSNADCADMTLGSFNSSPTLTGFGTLISRGQFLWASGTMGGSGRTVIDPEATLQIDSSNGVGLQRTLENGGLALWTGVGSIGLLNGVITNRASALFEAQTDATIFAAGGTTRFDNDGIFRKAAGGGVTVLTTGLQFNNTGTVEIQTGTLLSNGSLNNNGEVILSAGTTNRIAASGSAAGSFTAPETALVEWTGGTYTLNPGAQLNGAGLYRINGIGANVVGNGNITVQNLDLVHSSSAWSGAGLLTIVNAMNWTTGLLDGPGRTLIYPTAMLQLGSAGGVSLHRTLENGGTALWTGAGTLIMLNGIITNRAGALFEALNDARFFNAGGSSHFDNVGTFRKSASSGTTLVEMGFANYGTVDIRSGVLRTANGYVSAPNALLNFAIGGTSSGTGYGQLQVAGAVTLDGALSVDFLPDFAPATNDTFTVLNASSRSGAFANFLYPSDVVSMQLSYSSTSVILRVMNVLAPFPLPGLFTPERAGSNLKLNWTAVPNTNYRLEFNPDLTSSNWTAVPGDITATDAIASKLDTLSASNRFYRILVSP